MTIKHTINGVTKTPKEWAAHYGIDVSLVRVRIHNGWDVERAFSTPARFTHKMYEHNGETKTLTEWCKTTGVNRLLAYGRIKKGATLEEAILNVRHPRGTKPKARPLKVRPPRTDPYGVEMDGEVKTIAQWCAEYKMDYVTVKQRVYNGWDLKLALTTPVRSYVRKP